MVMFDNPTDPSSFLDSPPYYDTLTAAAGLHAPQTIEGGKKKPAKVHPCPYACVDASGQPRMFTCQHNVQQHVREKHTKERPYKCEICDDSRRGFNRPFTYNRHMAVFHGIRTGPGKGHGVRRGKQNALAAPDFGAQAIGPVDFDFNDYPAQEPSLQIEGGTNDDFAYAENSCQACKTIFFDRETMLSHLHIDHGQKPSPLCTCMTCSAVYRHDAGGAAELKQQLEAGGFGVKDGSQSPAGLAAGLDASIDFGQNDTFGEVHVPLLAKPDGFEGLFAEDLLDPQAVDGGQDAFGIQDGALTQGNGGFGVASQKLGLQSEYDFGDLAAHGANGSGFGGMDFEGMDFGGLNDFDGIQGLGDMVDMDMAEGFPAAGQAAGGAKQAEAPNMPPLYSLSDDARVAEAEDIFSQL